LLRASGLSRAYPEWTTFIAESVVMSAFLLTLLEGFMNLVHTKIGVHVFDIKLAHGQECREPLEVIARQLHGAANTRTLRSRSLLDAFAVLALDAFEVIRARLLEHGDMAK
jgi:hypothetical protein